MRRAAVSIPANIAEGFGKRSQADEARHLNIAEASVGETPLISYLRLISARHLGYGQTHDLMHTLEEVSRLLNSYARSILGPWLTVWLRPRCSVGQPFLAAAGF